MIETKPVLKLLPKEPPSLTDDEISKRASIVAALKELTEEAINGNLDSISIIYQTDPSAHPSFYSFSDAAFLALAGTILHAQAIDRLA